MRDHNKIDVKDLPNAIQWHEGMLIGPHHFQQAFIRQEGLLRYHLQNIAPFCWGIREVAINKSLLVSGIFSVDRLQAVMPDGLEVAFSKDESSALEIDLNNYKDDIRKKDLTIFLTVPTQTVDSSVGKGELKRYESVKGEMVPDTNTGDNPLLIPRLKPALSLLILDELSAKYSGFPLAKITFKDANFMMTDYIAPGLSISALPKIEDIGKQIVQQLREKASFLSEKIQSTSTASGLAMTMETKDMIRSVVSALPYFETALRSRELHPYTLYQAMALLVGHLASLDQGFIPPILAPYDHNDLKKIFGAAHEYIFRVTEQGIQEKYSCHSFTYDSEECWFNIQLNKAWITKDIIIGVRGQPGMNHSEVKKWMNKCVIGSESVIPSMRERRISGVQRKAIEGNEFLVPLRGVQLFSLTVDEKFIVPDENLMIVNPANQVSGTSRADEIVIYVENALLEPEEKDDADSTI
ncbi:type VI secretion system baseplate subunit TssK [bacterium]|nr:type VI secretion system baseplate subunit TssK [bacterium]